MMGYLGKREGTSKKGSRRQERGEMGKKMSKNKAW